MKRTINISIGIFALLAIIGVIIHMTTRDGLKGVIADMFFEDSTQYAPGYSDNAFRTVKIGMSESQVYTLLGQPLDSHTTDGNLYLLYSIPKKSHFRDRRVILHDGVVTEKNAEFYVD